jgi:hypothetical protein
MYRFALVPVPQPPPPRESVYVKAIDYTNRIVILDRPDSVTLSLKVGPDAPNFNRIQVGDNLMTTAAESYVAYLVKPGVSPGSITNYLETTAPPGVGGSDLRRPYLAQTSSLLPL